MASCASCSQAGGCSSATTKGGDGNCGNPMAQQDKAIAARLGHIRHKIFVMSGKGGVGKSSVTVNTAAALAHKGYKVGILDVDIHGPSVPNLLGLTSTVEMDETTHALLPAAYDENLAVISMDTLLQDKDQAVLWRGPKKTAAIRQFISDVQWGELDFLLIDSPPGTGDEHMTVLQSIPDALCVVVTTPQEISLADVRKAINAVELLYRGARTVDGGLYVTRDDALQLSQCSAMRYDREGDDHYDLLSALHKSIRGSDPDAAVYYLGRLLVAGDLISPCRRLLCIAAEDIGLAYPQAITVTKSCVDAALQLGLPEARLPLAEAAVLLATAPKSNSAHNAIIAAMEDIQRGAVGDIPRHLKNVHADSAGADKAPAYKYPHNYPDHYVQQRYLPESLGDTHYYAYGENKTEQAAKRYWDDIKGKNGNGPAVT